MKISKALLSVIFALFWMAPSYAQKETSYSEYKILIHGFTLARLKFTTEWDGTTYKVTGDIASSALADIVAKTRGSMNVTGMILPDRLQGIDYEIDYVTGGKRRMLAVRFDESGNVENSYMEPPAERPPSDWVPISDQHLKSVVDPLSSLTFPARAANEPICGRTISIFDGETALDLKLTFQGYRRFRTQGFKGRVIACQVTFHPTGGYRADHDSIKYLQRSKHMEVWFGYNDQAKLYAPVFAKIPTKIGNVRVWASKFGV